VRRPRFDSSLFRFFRFKSKTGELVLPSAKILAREVEQPEESVRSALNLREGDKVIHFSRIRLIEGQPVLMEEIRVPLALFEALASLPIDEFGDLMYPLYEQRCQQVVAKATETLTVEQATEAVAETLGVSPASPVILVQRLASDFGGRPIEWRSTRGPAATFQYQVEIR
jgi:GntR family transcriptional regulator